MLNDWFAKLFQWWMSLTDWWINRRREANVHEEFMHTNIISFKAALPPITGDDLDRQLTLYTKYEEYITRARQAKHPTLTMYNLLAIAFAGVLIALSILGGG